MNTTGMCKICTNQSQTEICYNCSTSGEWKKCKKCKKELPLSHFYRNKGNKDGYTTRCKDCIYKSQKARKEGTEKSSYKTDAMWIAEGAENIRNAYERYGANRLIK